MKKMAGFGFLAKRHAQCPCTDLRNVKGLEDADWQQTASSTDHNEYWDIPAYGGFGNAGISRFCNSCRTDFHSTRFGPWSGNGEFKAGPGGGWHTSPWFRHPSGIYLPAFGETSKYNTDGTGPPGVPGMFNPDVPVARQFIDTVTGGRAWFLLFADINSNGNQFGTIFNYQATQNSTLLNRLPSLISFKNGKDCSGDGAN